MDQKIKDIGRLEAHDRLEQVTKTESEKIAEGIRECISLNPFEGLSPYVYIFAHRRKGDWLGAPDRIIWQPRLTRPKPETNSMLFKVYEDFPDDVHVLWIIPPREMWESYKKGSLFEHELVISSIYDFEHDRRKLERSDPDDLSDEHIEEIYREISIHARSEKNGPKT